MSSSSVKSTAVEALKKQKKATALKEEPRKHRSSSKATNPSEIRSTFDLWEEFCRRGVTIFEETSKQIETVKKNDVASLALRDSQLSTIAQKMETLSKTTTDHHEFVKLNLKPATLIVDEETVQKIISHLSEEIEKGIDQLHGSIEDAKNATNIRVEEVELEVRNVRLDVQKVSHESVASELQQKFFSFQTEVTKRLDELGARQMEILSLLKKDKKRESTPQHVAAESSESSNRNRRPLEKKIKRRIQIGQGGIARSYETHKEISRVRHEIFSLTHRIEEAQKVRTFLLEGSP